MCQGDYSLLRVDEDFVAATAPEALLRERLCEARVLLSRVRVTCSGEDFKDCGPDFVCGSCGGVMRVTCREANDETK